VIAASSPFVVTLPPISVKLPRAFPPSPTSHLQPLRLRLRTTPRRAFPSKSRSARLETVRLRCLTAFRYPSFIRFPHPIPWADRLALQGTAFVAPCLQVSPSSGSKLRSQIRPGKRLLSGTFTYISILYLSCCSAVAHAVSSCRICRGQRAARASLRSPSAVSPDVGSDASWALPSRR
jgi:hypothetical protein